MTAPYNCVIVADGQFPSEPALLDLLRKAPVIIACDGAVRSLHERGIIPASIVGDMDSIPEPLRRQYAGRIHAEKEQETNDLTKAVRFARNAGHTEALILGATGLREDHTLGNISLLMDYAPMFKRIEMASDYGRFTPLFQTATLESVPGQQISIFSMHPGSEITTEGLRGPVNRRRFTAWWQGTLNEALGTTFTLTLSPGSQVIVYRRTVYTEKT
jgi:thiamine pyrophosphokinase